MVYIPPGEPPAGIARLKGILNQHNIQCSLIDVNLEAIHYLLRQKGKSNDVWTKIAFKNIDLNLKQIRGEPAFKNIDHYNRIVKNLNRVINVYGQKYN